MRLQRAICLFWFGFSLFLSSNGFAQDVDYFRFQNRWNPDRYLHIERGYVDSGPVLAQWYSAMWSIENADSGYVRLRNRWKPEQYLHIEYGNVQSGQIQPQWFSAMWLVSVLSRQAGSTEVGTVAAGLQTTIENGRGEIVHVITDDKGTRVFDKNWHAEWNIGDRADRDQHQEVIEKYKEGGQIVPDSDRPAEFFENVESAASQGRNLPSVEEDKPDEDKPQKPDED